MVTATPKRRKSGSHGNRTPSSVLTTRVPQVAFKASVVPNYGKNFQWKEAGAGFEPAITNLPDSCISHFATRPSFSHVSWALCPINTQILTSQPSINNPLFGACRFYSGFYSDRCLIYFNAIAIVKLSVNVSGE